MSDPELIAITTINRELIIRENNSVPANLKRARTTALGWDEVER